MILNKAQAEAVRDAICALNNVGMVADIYLPQHDIDEVICVAYDEDGSLNAVYRDGIINGTETYPDFDAFVKAYGLVP